MSQALATRDDDDDRFESAIVRAASDQSIDIGKLQALLDMQRMVARERAVRMFTDRDGGGARRDGASAARYRQPAFKSRYAKLETIDRAMRPVYTRFGFSGPLRLATVAAPRLDADYLRGRAYRGTLRGKLSRRATDDAGPQGRTNKTSI